MAAGRMSGQGGSTLWRLTRRGNNDQGGTDDGEETEMAMSDAAGGWGIGWGIYFKKAERSNLMERRLL